MTAAADVKRLAELMARAERWQGRRRRGLRYADEKRELAEILQRLHRAPSADTWPPRPPCDL